MNPLDRLHSVPNQFSTGSPSVNTGGDKPDSVSSLYARMSEKWLLLHDLRGGTASMRAAGKRWLPQEPNEKEDQYLNRLQRSFLYGAFGDTIDKIVAKPFSRAVQTQGELPESLTPIIEDVDRTGKDLTQFLREVFDSGVMYGFTHVLVDYPSVKPDVTLTLEDEKTLGVRPVFIHIKPPQLLGWQTAYTESGLEELISIRFKECRIEPDGEFGEREVVYIRYYSKNEWRIYKQEENGEWSMKESGTHTFGRVPLFTVYFNRTGFMQADPPLEDLAWMNVAHWQSYSDQRNILRFVRVGLLFVKGLTPDDMDKGVVIGPGRIIRTASDIADMKYVETTGKGIECGAADLKAIEDRMEALGNQPLMARTGDQTATGQAIDEARTQADIKAWVRITEKFAVILFKAAAEWAKVEIESEFAVDLNDDFGSSFRGAEDMPHLITMRQTGDLSQETFLRETKRRGILSDEVEITEEMERIETEGPKLSTLPAPVPDPQTPEADDDEEDDDEEIPATPNQSPFGQN
jgi:hypothetical protein